MECFSFPFSIDMVISIPSYKAWPGLLRILAKSLRLIVLVSLFQKLFDVFSFILFSTPRRPCTYITKVGDISRFSELPALPPEELYDTLVIGEFAMFVV